MSRIITIGSENFVLAFQLQGIDGFIATAKDFMNIINIILKDESISIVFLEDSIYYAHKDFIDDLKISRARPLFIEIPMEEKGLERDPISDLIRKSIGISID